MDVKLTAMPGESLVTAIFQFATASRETMSQTNRDRLDAIQISMLEDWVKFWRKLTPGDNQEIIKP